MSDGGIVSPLYSAMTPITFVPATGDTISFADNGGNQKMWANPAGTLLNLTVNLPSEANSQDGQICTLGTRRAVTNLVISAIGGGVTVFNAPITSSAGTMFFFQKMAPNTWTCIQ